jgi:uncharacterized membrane protein|tara:strand:- start:929 stop:1339 length:411 start_codon:yes stop_codon:yes gene_type:complete
MDFNFLHKRGGEHPAISKRKLTLGQRSADSVTKWVGSWAFIIGIIIFMAIWIAINVYFLFFNWDPYPFILLNFVLSCLAAMQAPIILMSQNRETHRDRLQARYDYDVNKKAEHEIQDLQKDMNEIKKMLRSLARKK